MMTTVSIALVAALSAGASAHEGDGLCGAYAFPPIPDSLHRAVAPSGRPTHGPFAVGDHEQLHIFNYVDQKFELLTFTYRAVNPRCYVLVDDRYYSLTDQNRITPNDVARLSEVFESNSGPSPGLGKGIYDIETTAYAPVTPVPEVGGDPMVYIALTEIKSSLSDGYIVGYVAPGDRFPKSVYPNSNERNLIVIDATSRTSDARRERTLSHEFLHVIHRGIDYSEERWIDEGIAVYSQTLCGYDGNSGDEFFQNPNIGLFDDGSQPTIADYDKAYLITLYMSDQYGPNVLGSIVRSRLRGVDGVDAGLAAAGFPDRFTGDVYPGWAIANLSPPHPTSRYAYRSYDPRSHHPQGFGDAGPLPIREQRTLVSYGLRYVRAGASPVVGDFTGSTIPVWTVASVEERNGVLAPRRWFQAELGRFRDCAFADPWLVVTPLAVLGGEHSYELEWRAAELGADPVVVDQRPTGVGVLPHVGRIRAEFGNVDPESQISVVVTSDKSGTLARDLRIMRYGLRGRCGETVVVVDSSSAPLPADDQIAVLVSELYSASGGMLTSQQASWTFHTGPADTDGPIVTIGLLSNPAFPSRVTAVVYSNESLYPDGGGPVRLVGNGSITVSLQAQDATMKKWMGTAAFQTVGQYDFVLRATDLAGNAPADPTATYTLIAQAGSARPARAVPGEGADRPPDDAKSARPPSVQATEEP